MYFIKKANRKGFTLIELVIVVAVLVILAAIAIPVVSGVIESAKVSTDKANLSTLNAVTSYYAVQKVTTTVDVFDGESTDEARMQELVTNGYLSELVVPQQHDAQFDWDIASQKWIISGVTEEPTETEPTTLAVESISLNKTSTSLVAPVNGGHPETLVATILPASASNKAVTWTSSNTGVATVDTNGQIVFVNPGTTVITARTVDGGKTATCNVSARW